MVGKRVWVSVGRRSARVVALLGVFAVVWASGCAGKSSGGDDPDACPSVCENGSKCPGAPPLTRSCDDTCLYQDALATESNCHDLYVASINCSAALTNTCTALIDCKTQIDAANACEQAYCAQHRSAEVCVNDQ